MTEYFNYMQRARMRVAEKYRSLYYCLILWMCLLAPVTVTVMYMESYVLIWILFPIVQTLIDQLRTLPSFETALTILTRGLTHSV